MGGEFTNGCKKEKETEISLEKPGLHTGQLVANLRKKEKEKRKNLKFYQDDALN